MKKSVPIYQYRCRVGIMKILIIGGSDAGVSDTLCAREIESGSKVTF